MKNFLWLGVLATMPWMTPLLSAQEEAAANPVQEAFEAWEAETELPWLMRLDQARGVAQMLYGSKLAMPFEAVTDADFFDLGREALDQTHGMFRIDDLTLVEVRVKHLHLSHIGTTDKVAVNFVQEVNGVPVVHGYANVLFSHDGELLAIQSTALPDLENFNTAPATSSYAAIAKAHAGFIELEDREASLIETPELVIFGQNLGKSVTARLAWSIEVRNEEFGSNGLPSGRRMYVSADGFAEVIGNDQLIHTAMPQDLTGQVVSWATPGVAPDIATNPEIQKPMGFIQVTSSAGNAITDVNGNFTIPNAGPNAVNVTATYFGDWANVNNDAGADYSITASLTPGVPGTIVMNPGRSEFETAQANGYAEVVNFREWIKSVDPSDTTMDFRVINNVNQNSACNAFFNGSSINHFRALSGCVNTSYSTVIAHEEGHWANVVYGSGNGSDGFGEGGADVWSMYINDTAIVGDQFFGAGGGFIRTGNNTRQWCGSGCYGQVHTDGEVMMGALWKVRRNLNTTYGNTTGDDIANALMLGWYNSYNQTTIGEVIEDQWLTLDDNNGNIFDGTPNYTDIDSAFREQGFPGIDLQLIDIQHTPLPNTQNETGPYTVNAVISSLTGASITSAEVKYSVNGGPENTVVMTNTGGNSYTGDIPGQTSVAFVDYYIEASDNNGNNQNEPRVGEYSFVVGVFTQYEFFDFEAASDEGWTHGLIATQDDWQRGAPQGKVQDPGSAFSGTNVWANDLGNPGWNGEYASNTNNWLQSPSFDLTGATGVRLRFQRHLSVEQRNSTSNPYDRAELLVNGTSVWINPLATDVIDSNWTLVDYDISAIADNNANVQVRFEMESDGGVEFGGWTIDDLEIYSVEPVPGNKDVILLTGDTNGVVGGTVSYNLSNCPQDSIYLIYYSKNLNGTTIAGHMFDIGDPFFTAFSGVTDGNGNASWTSGPIPPKGAGQTVFVEARSDSTTEVFDSNVVTLVIQ